MDEAIIGIVKPTACVCTKKDELLEPVKPISSMSSNNVVSRSIILSIVAKEENKVITIGVMHGAAR